jgi:hypothetical protein
MVHGSLLMVHGSWFMVHGLFSLVPLVSLVSLPLSMESSHKLLPLCTSQGFWCRQTKNRRYQ